VSSNPQPGREVKSLAFTLVELLVVIAVLAILAGLLLPAVAKAKAKSQAIYCANNMRQMQLAWYIYADQNEDVMPLNDVNTEGNDVLGSWVLGNAGLQADLSNLTNGTLYPYVGNVRSYRCPTDFAKTAGGVPVTRSYAIQVSLHSIGIVAAFTWPAPYMQFADCVKVASLVQPGPARTWTFIEPSAASHDYGSWDFYVLGLNQTWAHQPSDRHSSGCNLSFADGHVERYGWKAPHEGRGTTPVPVGSVGGANDHDDYRRLLDGAPRYY
jgi:prepilin-type processing-associated H-X9-DG protein/prepilin-type N-terminal cleavage/methylation domain-containing protein